MRLLFARVAIVIGLTACASSSAAPTRTSTETLRVLGSEGGAVTLTSSTVANVSHVPFTVEQVWGVLPAIYDSLGIPISTLDATERAIGNAGLNLRRRLGNVSLSRYIDCGNTQIGENADSYDVHLKVITRVQPAEGGMAAVATTVEAAAKPVTFAQAYSRCSSKGVLEKRLADAVKLRLSR